MAPLTTLDSEPAPAAASQHGAIRVSGRSTLYAAALMGLSALSLPTLSGAVTPGAPDPRVRQLMQQMHAALGGARLDATPGIELSGHYELGGLRGTFQQTIDFEHGRDVLAFDVGVTRGQEGLSGEGAWWTDEKGLTTLQDAPEALADAATESYEDRNGWLYPDPAVPMHYAGSRDEAGERFDLLQIQPPGARALTLWIDRRTHRPARLTEWDAVQGGSTTFFADYRPIQGIWFPFHQRLASGDRSAEIVMDVTHARLVSKLPQRLFQAPTSTYDDARLLPAAATAPGDAGSAPHASAVQLPFTLRDGQIIVQASLDGRPALPFVLDSGGISSVTPATAERLQLGSAGSLPLYGAGTRPIAVQLTHIRTLQLGRAQLSDQQFLVVPLPPALTYRGRQPPLAGLIGYELFRRFIVTIDYQQRVLTLALPSLATPAADAAERLPLLFDGRRPFVRAAVDGVPGDFGVDTGDDGALTLFGHFYALHVFPIELPGLVSGEAGVGGTTATLMTRVDTLALGHLTLSRPLTQLNFAPSGAFASQLSAGNIGSQVLQNFIVTLDFTHRYLYLQPSARFGQPMAYNRSGIWLGVDAAGLPVITALSAGSPGALSGLRVGDRLLAIDDRPLRDRDYHEVTDLFEQAAGTRLDLTVLRDGRPRRLSLTLREMLPPDAALQSVPVGPAASGQQTASQPLDAGRLNRTRNHSAHNG